VPKTLSILPACLIAFLCLPASAVAQQDWREELSSDQVTVADGRFTYEEFGILSLELPGYEPVEFQMKILSDAPADGTISRDSFMSLTSSMMTIVMLAGFAEAYAVSATEFFNGFDYRELDAPIGTPDVELNLWMTGEGMQFEFVNTSTDEKSRTVWTWDEFYQQ
jgi:hypothetical protein